MTLRPATNASCPVFMHNYVSPLTHWLPWQEGGPRPDRATLAAFQRIYANQHPPDCRKSKFLAMSSEWEAGLGSSIHTKATALLLALQLGRVLVDAPRLTWMLTDGESCPRRDWTCYFLPFTNCSLPRNWAEGATSYDNTSWAQEGRVVVMPPTPYALLDEDWDDQSTKWWHVRTTMYLIRPNKRTLSAACFVWSCAMGRGGAGLLRPLASVFIRGGDKWKEAKLRSAREYFLKLQRINRTRPLRSVWIGTDDARVLHDVLEDFAGSWHLLWLGYHRDVGGLAMEEVVSRYNTSRVDWQVLLSLSDLFIAATADVFMGTLSSNWCRLADEFRQAHGKARPFVSLDDGR